MPDPINLAHELAERDPVPFGSIPGAYVYHDQTPAHRFTSVVAPILQEEYCVTLPSRDSFDERFASNALSFVLSHSSGLSVGIPLVILENFDGMEYCFDCIAVLSPLAAKQYEHEHDRLNRKSFVAFPIYRCELSGDESIDLIDLIRHDFLPSLDWKRSPHPKVSMAFQNATTKTRSTGTRPGLTRLQNVLKEIEDLSGTNGNWIKLVNYAGRHMQIEWSDGHFIFDTPNQEVLYLDKSTATGVVREFVMRDETPSSSR